MCLRNNKEPELVEQSAQNWEDWGRRSGKGTPFSFSSQDTDSCCCRPGHRLQAPQRSHSWLVSLETRGEKPSICKDEGLVLASYTHPWAAKYGYRSIILKTYSYPLTFFNKNTHMHRAGHGTLDSVQWRLDLVCKVSAVSWIGGLEQETFVTY